MAVVENREHQITDALPHFEPLLCSRVKGNQDSQTVAGRLARREGDLVAVDVFPSQRDNVTQPQPGI